MNQVNLITPPHTNIIARGRESLLLRESDGRHSFIDLREAAAYDLFSETFKFAIGKISNSPTERLEPLYQSGEMIGFYLGSLLALFDDNLPLSGLAKRSVPLISQPPCDIARNAGHRQAGKCFYRSFFSTQSKPPTDEFWVMRFF